MFYSRHGETPTQENTELFLNIVENFIRQNPTSIIGIHCTHGFNRSGFLICSYLVEKLDYSIDMAVALFADARPNGIYKQDYLNELFKRYSDPSLPIPEAPPLPTWEEEEEDHGARKRELDLSDDEFDGGEADESGENPKRSKSNPKRIRSEETKANPVFADPELKGIEACIDPDEIAKVRSEIKSLCQWGGNAFPGAQPVSMDQKNVNFLREKRYNVSWKADGTRYLMYINGRHKVYMIDRDNSVFHARNLVFPYRKDLDKHLVNTLLDGVRFLIFFLIFN